ncbi:hypothetical protein DVG78_16765 [Runella aurantiaca]|uniref:Uncharacterized protein n=1 Tax=Runella aurantiaca TaxID=2282308 RepID=A0A369I5N9_9BACT|nr:hypothetical protein DVG78_16765 [Runella aurantiaca]
MCILQLKGYQYIHQINSFFFTIDTYKGYPLAVIVGVLHHICFLPNQALCTLEYALSIYLYNPR